MIQIIAGLQGAGKTKSLIDLANAESKTTHGHLVYVDADNSHILQLSHKIRLIKPDDYPLESPDEFFWLCLWYSLSGLRYLYGLYRRPHEECQDRSGECGSTHT